MDWQTIDTAPMGVWVMVWDGDENFIACGHETPWRPAKILWHDKWGEETGTELFPTHWRPLPEPPKGS